MPLSERRPLQGKNTDTLMSGAPLQNEEAQLRRALEHMGGSRISLRSSPSGGSSTGQRHRYVRDGEVPVVHANLGRPAMGRPDASAPQDAVLIETLRQNLEQERARREAAERSLHEARASLTALQTRLGHVELDLQAAQEQVAVQQAAAEQALAEQAASQAASQQATDRAEATITSPAPGRSRPRSARRTSAPKPIKWWIKPGKD